MSLTTSRAVATFISTASTAFGSTDFLYLSYVQDRVKTLRASLTDQKILLRKIPWDRFAKKLEGHALGNPSSGESIAVKRLKEMLLAVSGLPDSIPIPREMAAQYKIAVEMGGDKGIAAFADFAALPLPM